MILPGTMIIDIFLYGHLDNLQVSRWKDRHGGLYRNKPATK